MPFLARVMQYYRQNTKQDNRLIMAHNPNTTQKFTDNEKSVFVHFVYNEHERKYMHQIEITNPLVYGCLDWNFLFIAVRKAIKHFIGFLDYSKGVDYAISDTIIGLNMHTGKVYTNKDGKIRFTF